MLALLAASADIFGQITPPQGVDKYDAAAAVNGAPFGLVLFVSNMIKIATVVAGLWVFFNIISAGLMFISASGDSSVPTKAKDQILHSVIGLAIIAFSYLIIALVSYVLFHDPTYILNPTIVGPG